MIVFDTMSEQLTRYISTSSASSAYTSSPGFLSSEQYSLVQVNNDSSGTSAETQSTYLSQELETTINGFTDTITFTREVKTLISETESFDMDGGIQFSSTAVSSTFLTTQDLGTTWSSGYSSSSTVNTGQIILGTFANLTTSRVRTTITSTLSRTFTSVFETTTAAPYTSANLGGTFVTTVGTTTYQSTVSSKTWTNTDSSGRFFTASTTVTLTGGRTRDWTYQLNSVATSTVRRWESVTDIDVSWMEDGWISTSNSTFFKNELGYLFTTYGKSTLSGFDELKNVIGGSFTSNSDSRSFFTHTIFSATQNLESYTLSIPESIDISLTYHAADLTTVSTTYITTYGFLPFPTSSTITSTQTVSTINSTFSNTLEEFQINIPLNYTTLTQTTPAASYITWNTYFTTTVISFGSYKFGLYYTLESVAAIRLSTSVISYSNSLSSQILAHQTGMTILGAFTTASTMAQGQTTIKTDYVDIFEVITSRGDIVSNTSSNGAGATGTISFHLSAIKPVMLEGFRAATADEENNVYFSQLNATVPTLSTPIYTENTTTITTDPSTTSTSYQSIDNLTNSTITFPFISLDQISSVYVIVTFSAETSITEDAQSIFGANSIIKFTGPNLTDSVIGAAAFPQTTIFSFGSPISVTQKGLAVFKTTTGGNTYYCFSDFRSTTYSSETTNTSDPTSYSTIRFGTFTTSNSYTLNTALAGAVTASISYSSERIFDNNHKPTATTDTTFATGTGTDFTTVPGTTTISTIHPFGLGGFAPVSSLQESLSASVCGIIYTSSDMENNSIASNTTLFTTLFSTSSIPLSRIHGLDSELFANPTTAKIGLVVFSMSKYLLFDGADGRPPDNIRLF